MYADVLLFRGVPTSYTYQIPESLAIEPGDHVEVPFGRSTCKGCVLSVSSTLSKEMKLKSILGKTNHPKLTEDTLDLISWLSKTYLTTPYAAYQTIVGNRKYRDLSQEKATAKPPIISGPPPTEEQEAALEQRETRHAAAAFLSARTTSHFAPAGSRRGVFAMRCCGDQRGAQSSASQGQCGVSIHCCESPT